MQQKFNEGNYHMSHSHFLPNGIFFLNHNLIAEKVVKSAEDYSYH